MKSVYTLLIGLFSIQAALAFQSTDLIIAELDEHEISSSEFLYAFKKNRDESEVLNIDSLKLYLENYINFKLKVLEARKQGYDTIKTFQEELKSYLDQIRKPYLQNPEAEERLVTETYRRMTKEINASHLLIKVEPDVAPEDTLKAYKFIDSLRLTVNSKTHFEELAKRYSQDGASQNGGQLGWFSALDMVAPFEQAAYSTNENSVSEVVKTQFGYHILYVNQTRPSRGKLKTSHIFFSNRGRSLDDAHSLALSIFDSLKSGADWNTMARKYSDDNRTKMNGGQLPWARIKQLPDEFFDIGYALKTVNDISEPRRTRFGWHIVKLDDVDPIGSLEENRASIEQQLKRSGRNVLNKDQLIRKLKSENGYLQDKAILDRLVDEIGKGKVSEELQNETVFRIDSKVFSVRDFISTLPSQNISLNKNLFRSLYKEFEHKTILEFEDSIAPSKYPEYGFLQNEYEEGLLLFEVMQAEVWNKAIEDSIGAKNYYKAHLEQYKVGTRAEVMVVSSRDESLIQRIIGGPENTSSFNSQIESKLSKEEQSLLKIVKRTIRASEISKFGSTELVSGSWIKNSDNSEYYFIDRIAPPGYLSYDEIKGRVLSNYQDHLELEWIRSLRAKTDIKVNMEALRELVEN